MPTMQVDVAVSELMNAIGISSLPEHSEFYGREYARVEVTAEVEESDVVAAGFTPDDEIPDEDDLRAEALAALDLELSGLADGLRSLIAGDRAMAAVLLTRALNEWPDAGRVVEDILLGRTHHDRRQATLALAA